MPTKRTDPDADGRIGERVRAARMADGLNQTELGHETPEHRGSRHFSAHGIAG